ncbi:hypothetical protein CPB83DRAFT_896840 [Crepidotus variabilis]|uniref:Uncharacterized protein n=1 Tax=Crepidotus variabilis TaxID=179855 RepID=A0A9P6EAA5_9AGAR|nr:hypothetical protein CPB83DRAFT_896840 [Crepidotus variabilis]
MFSTFTAKKEDYHKKVVHEHLKKIPAAKTAVIKNLAHSIGSVDPYIHISAALKDSAHEIIKAPRRGDPTQRDPIHHVYTNPHNPADGKKHLPKIYMKHVDKHLVKQGKKPGQI